MSEFSVSWRSRSVRISGGQHCADTIGRRFHPNDSCSFINLNGWGVMGEENLAQLCQCPGNLELEMGFVGLGCYKKYHGLGA